MGYPLQYSWASMVAQLVKNLPAMRETLFDPWVGKIPLEKEIATHSSILALRIPRWFTDKHSSCNAGDVRLIPGL